MNADSAPSPLDQVLLTHALETVVRPLVGRAIGQMSLVKLQELVELIYVEEAERHLQAEFPGKPVHMTQLGLLTELDTRQVHRIRKSPAYRADRLRHSPFMNNFTPTTRLLDKWSTDRRYLQGRTRKPRVIGIFGPCPSIEHLMKESRFARGITPRAVVDRLELSGAVSVDHERERLTMRSASFLPAADRDREGAAEVGFNAVHRLLATVLENLAPAGAGAPRKFQRCYWTNRLPAARGQAFRDKLTGLMAKFESRATRMLRDSEAGAEDQDQLTAGFGVYYFEDPASPQPLD